MAIGATWRTGSDSGFVRAIASPREIFDVGRRRKIMQAV